MVQKNKKLFFPARGFTIIEILVVVAIVGLMSALSIVAIGTVQKNGRDAKRKADLAQIQVALDRYYQRYNRYPDEARGEGCITFFWALCLGLSSCDTSMGTAASINNACGTPGNGPWNLTDLQPLLTEGFLTYLPRDPVNRTENGIPYLYILELDSKDDVNGTGQGTPGCTKGGLNQSCRYILQTLLENGIRTSGTRGTCIYTLQGGGGTPHAWDAANCKGSAIPPNWPNGACCRQ